MLSSHSTIFNEMSTCVYDSQYYLLFKTNFFISVPVIA